MTNISKTFLARLKTLTNVLMDNLCPYLIRHLLNKRPKATL